jgi:hypothetical protein
MGTQRMHFQEAVVHRLSRGDGHEVLGSRLVGTGLDDAESCSLPVSGVFPRPSPAFASPDLSGLHVSNDGLPG